MIFDWDEKKDEKLKNLRNICFEDVVNAVRNGQLIGTLDNPSKNHPDQKIYIVQMQDYIYAVPYVENESVIFLKTIIPSRKLTKKYLQR